MANADVEKIAMLKQDVSKGYEEVENNRKDEENLRQDISKLRVEINNLKRKKEENMELEED